MNLTYKDFINSKRDTMSAGLIPEKAQTPLNIIQALENPSVKSLLNHFPFVYYLLNYKTQQFELLHNSRILGYSDHELMMGGLQASLNNIHPTDSKVISDEIFPMIWEFISNVTDDPGMYRFSLNFRYLRKDKTYMHLQQHMTFLDFTDNKLPSRNLSVIYDISNIKSDTTINLVVSRIESDKEDIVLQKRVFP